MISHSPTGTILAWNPAASRLLGHASAGVIGTSIFDLVPAELLDGETAMFRRVAAGEPVETWQTEWIHADGHRVGVTLIAIPITAADSTVVSVTTIGRSAGELLTSPTQARQTAKMEALGQLTSGIAHDFNNILTVIEGFASFLQKEVPPGSPGHPDLVGIVRAAQHASALTQQLLTFSRTHRPQATAYDLSLLIDESTALLRRVLGEQIRLRVETPTGAVIVAGDRAQMAQVLLNLAINARDAMPDGGTLSISTHADPEASAVAIVVRDTGRGMDDATRLRAFEPFFTTKLPGEGTGLGLATVQTIVREAGGLVEVESAVGKGTVIRIVLPQAALPQNGQSEQGQRQAPGSAGSETVLVVDDEPAVVALNARTLEHHGYTVLRATSAGAALMRFGELGGAVDLLLTDMVMPHMNGATLAARLRLQKPDLRVLYVSGYTDGDFKSELDASAPLLRKPYSPDTLARTVRLTLDQSAVCRV